MDGVYHHSPFPWTTFMVTIESRSLFIIVWSSYKDNYRSCTSRLDGNAQLDSIFFWIRTFLYTRVSVRYGFAASVNTPLPQLKDPTLHVRHSCSPFLVCESAFVVTSELRFSDQVINGWCLWGRVDMENRPFSHSLSFAFMCTSMPETDRNRSFRQRMEEKRERVWCLSTPGSNTVRLDFWLERERELVNNYNVHK